MGSGRPCPCLSLEVMLQGKVEGVVQLVMSATEGQGRGALVVSAVEGQSLLTDLFQEHWLNR